MKQPVNLSNRWYQEDGIWWRIPSKNRRRSKGIIMDCLKCTKPYLVLPKELNGKRNQGRFCSHACSVGKLQLVSCLICCAPVRPVLGNGKRSKYCSRDCANKALLGKPGFWTGKKRENMSGPNNPRWVKDRTKLVKSEKKHLDSLYRKWMFAVKNRDGWKCKISNSDCSGRLEAHHILRWSEYPELRYEINNGITLCHAHHPREMAEEKRLQAEFQQLVASVSNV